MFTVRLVLCLFVCLGSISSVSAQLIDSLLAVLENQEGEEAVLTQYQLSEEYYKKEEVLLSRHYSRLAMLSGQELGFCKGGGSGAFYYAFSYIQEDSFFIVGKEVAAYMESCEHPYRQYLYHNLGDKYQEKGMYPEAIDAFQKALNSSEEAGNSFMAFQCMLSLAFVHDRILELDQALSWAQQALEKGRERGDSNFVAQAFGEMGSIYDLGDDPINAIHFHQKAITMARQAQDSFILCSELNNLGNTYRKTGELQAANSHLREALAIAKQVGSTDIQTVAQINLGDVLGKMGNTQQALLFFGKGKVQAAANGNVDFLMDHHEYRYKLHKRLGQFDSALHYYELNRVIKDTLYQAEKQKEISNLQVRFDTEQKEQQIALQQVELAARERENKQNLLLGGAVMLLLLVSATALFLRQQQRRKYEARLKDLQLKAEKERISRDLHDNVGAQLTGVITKLNTLEMNHKDGEKHNLAADTLASLDTHVRETMDLLRDTIWAIHKEEVTLEGLGSKLRQYLSRYLQGIPNLQWELKVTGDTTQQLSPNKALGIFRILQEAIQNVVKHAEASLLKIELKAEPGLHILIKDNGIGFDPTQESPNGHFGLQNMQDRAAELGTAFSLTSTPGEGTQLVLVLPPEGIDQN